MWDMLEQGRQHFQNLEYSTSHRFGLAVKEHVGCLANAQKLHIMLIICRSSESWLALCW